MPDSRQGWQDLRGAIIILHMKRHKSYRLTDSMGCIQCYQDEEGEKQQLHSEKIEVDLAERLPIAYLSFPNNQVISDR